MFRNALPVWLLGMAMFAFSGEPVNRLPQPDYHRHPSDPPWLAQVVQFHGHLGPSVVAGARIGMAALHAVDAKGYFDVEVFCEGPLARPPQSCLLDGLQMSTGATLGKRTLHWTQADRLLVRVKNVRTGKIAELHPTAALLDLLASFKPRPKNLDPNKADHKGIDERLEAIARQVASLPEQDLVTVTRPDATAPK